MENRNLALSLLFLAIVVSGCADNSQGKVSGKAISVEGPEVQPSEIFQGASVQASMAVENTGLIEGKVLVGDNGTQVMTNYCPDFFEIKKDGFRAYSSRNSNTSESYELKPGERVQMNWELNQLGQNVPLNGYECPIKFEVPFNYSVQAYHQIQVKQRDTEVESDLSSKTSQGPLTIAIETIGSSSESGAPIFLEDDAPEALFQIRNEDAEKSSFRGVIQVKDFHIETSGIELEGCSEYQNEDKSHKTIRINRNQMSDVIRCDITDMDLDGKPSKRAEIRASANYTYVKNVGSRNVEVKYRGN